MLLNLQQSWLDKRSNIILKKKGSSANGTAFFVYFRTYGNNPMPDCVLFGDSFVRNWGNEIVSGAQHR